VSSLRAVRDQLRMLPPSWLSVAMVLATCTLLDWVAVKPRDLWTVESTAAVVLDGAMLVCAVDVEVEVVYKVFEVVMVLDLRIGWQE
jgi:hypothetical protein